MISLFEEQLLAKFERETRKYIRKGKVIMNATEIDVSEWSETELLRYINNPVPRGRTYMTTSIAMSVMRHLFSLAFPAERVVGGAERDTAAAPSTDSADAVDQSCVRTTADGGSYYISHNEHILVAVTFDSSRTSYGASKRYNYRAWFRPKVGDKIIVDSPSDGYTIVTVRSVSNGWMPNYENTNYKWAVAPIDDGLYNERKRQFIAEQKKKMLMSQYEEAQRSLERISKELNSL